MVRYDPTMVPDSRPRISKFMLGVSKDIVKEYRAAMFVKEIDISSLMVYAQQIEKENHIEM